jgi:hypothetical protein
MATPKNCAKRIGVANLTTNRTSDKCSIKGRVASCITFKEHSLKNLQRQGVRGRDAALGSSKGEALSDELLDTINGSGRAIPSSDQPIEQAAVPGQTEAELLSQENIKRRIDYA